nr:hypothetical protein [Streptomyces agglomeratus]
MTGPSAHSTASPSSNNASARLGDLAKDENNGEIGAVKGFVGGRVQLRPLGGGTEWDAMPDRVVQPSAREELSARNAVRDAHCRSGL